jgi:hypothetical protein
MALFCPPAGLRRGLEVGAVSAYRGVFGGGSFDMVAMVEIVFLLVCAALGVWWFSRTSMWSRMKSGRQPGRRDLGRKKHELSRTQQELSRKNFRNDDPGQFYPH